MAEKQKEIAPDIMALLGELDADFGKKKKGEVDKDTAASRNRQFHANNPQLEASLGKSPESDRSGNWQPEAKITYIIRQTCMCCNNTVEFIGGEYIKFKSKKQFASILRASEHCPNLFLYDEIGEPLPDLIDEHNQLVSRCPGCIAVERQAEQIWGTVLEQQRRSFQQKKLDFDLTNSDDIKVEA